MTHIVNAALLLLGSSFAASIVAKATLIITAALIGAWLARGSRASLRHAVLAASFPALLGLPVASFLVPSVRIAVAREPTMAAPVAEGIDTTHPSLPTSSDAAVTSPVSRQSVFSLYDFLLAAWIAGAALFLLRIIAGLWQVRLLRQFGLPWRRGQSVVERLAPDAGLNRRVDVLLHESLSAPVTCGLIHPAIVLPLDAQNWDDEDLNRAIIHELEHVRRGDWINHCLARIVCAIYWFHPLVWIAWRRLALEAERSCDDAVLRSSEATAYADQLVELARRLSTARKSPALAMANRSDLSSRVRAVLDSGQRRGRAGAILTAIACAAAALVVVTMSPLRMVAAPQFKSAGKPATAAASPRFEVASVRPNASGARPVSIGFSPGRFNAENVWLRFLIQFAWQVQDFQLSGGLGWPTSDRYDIIARAAAGTSKEQMLPMLQELLKDRFQLALHQESKELPVYALVVGKGVAKLKATKEGSCVMPRSDAAPSPSKQEKTIPVCGGDLMTGAGRLSGTGISMADVAMALSRSMQRTVLDQTGLAGIYDVQLKWTSDQSTPGFSAPGPSPSPRGADSPEPDGSSIFTAIQEQLGLKLESSKGPVTVWVIDHAEKPSEN